MLNERQRVENLKAANLRVCTSSLLHYDTPVSELHSLGLTTMRETATEPPRLAPVVGEHVAVPIAREEESPTRELQATTHTAIALWEGPYHLCFVLSFI